MILLGERPEACVHTDLDAGRAGVPAWVLVRRTAEGRCPLSGLPRAACAATDEA